MTGTTFWLVFGIEFISNCDPILQRTCIHRVARSQAWFQGILQIVKIIPRS